MFGYSGDIQIYATASLLALGMISAPGAAVAQTHEPRLSIISPPTYFLNRELIGVAEDLKRETNGRFSLTVLPSNPETTALQQLQSGALDMAWVSTMGLEAVAPEFGAIHAPFLVRDIRQADKFFESEAALSLLDNLPRIGLVGLGYGMSGMRQIYLRDQVKSEDDLRDKKIRMLPSSASTRDFFADLHMTPASMPFREIYNRLATGEIDGVEMDLEGTADYMFHDFLKTLVLTNHSMLGYVAIVSAKVWSTLSPDDQVIIRSVMRKHLAVVRKNVINDEARHLERLRRSHLKVIELDPSRIGSAVAAWDQLWSAKVPALKAMRETAARL